MYAIFYLCMLNKSYVKGAIISAFVAKKYKPTNVELVCMCDNKLFRYKKYLLTVFDKVVKIKLLKVASEHHNEKYNWIKYSINKHQIYNYTNYEKILFLDTDILIFSKKFFNIFKCDAPSFYVRDIAGVKITKSDFKTFKKYDGSLNTNKINYNDEISKFNFFIDAGIMLIKPSEVFYKKYIKFIMNMNNINNTRQSGIDETTMIYYMVKNNINFHILKPQFNVSSWREKNKNAYSKNYISKINPWEKNKDELWDEEKIWYTLEIAIYKKYPYLKNKI